MARIRSIKPEFWSSEQIMECSTSARLLFIGLWNFCDDAGRHPHSPKQIKALVFPGDDFTADQVSGWLSELETHDLISTYEVSGRRYLQVTGWHHQKIDRPQPSKYPAPVSTISARTVDEHSTNGIDGKDRTGPDQGEDRTGPDHDSPNAIEPGRSVGFSDEFKNRLIASVEPEEVAKDLDFTPIVEAIALGATEADVIEAIRRAFKDRSSAGPFRKWRVFSGWISGVVSDRTAQRRPKASKDAGNGPGPPHRPGKSLNLKPGLPPVPVLAIREAVDRGQWYPKMWGPPRGQPGCLVPDWVFEKQTGGAAA